MKQFILVLFVFIDTVNLLLPTPSLPTWPHIIWSWLNRDIIWSLFQPQQLVFWPFSTSQALPLLGFSTCSSLFLECFAPSFSGKLCVEISFPVSIRFPCYVLFKILIVFFRTYHLIRYSFSHESLTPVQCYTLGPRGYQGAR